jgi:hypothetical protein
MSARSTDAVLGEYGTPRARLLSAAALLCAAAAIGGLALLRR